jgi:hypothetical protein
VAQVEALDAGDTRHKRAHFPSAFRTALIQFSEARTCSIQSTLSGALVTHTGKFQVVEHNGWCQLRFEEGRSS